VDIQNHYCHTNTKSKIKGLKCIICLILKISHLKVSNIIVNKTNFPRRGTTRDVGGMISARRRKKTVRESNILIDKLTFSPESDGK